MISIVRTCSVSTPLSTTSARSPPPWSKQVMSGWSQMPTPVRLETANVLFLVLYASRHRVTRVPMPFADGWLPRNNSKMPSLAYCMWERWAWSKILNDIDLTYEHDVGSIGSTVSVVEHIINAHPSNSCLQLRVSIMHFVFNRTLTYQSVVFEGLF